MRLCWRRMGLPCIFRICIPRGLAVLLAAGGTFHAASLAASAAPMEVRLLSEPTSFPSLGKIRLFYELHLKNSGPLPLDLREIDVLAPDQGGALVSRIQGSSLDQIFSNGHRRLAAGESAQVFVELDRDTPFPARLAHRLMTGSVAVEGPVVKVHTVLRQLAPPVEGSNWLASDGPGNTPDNHHRRGLVILGGKPVISRRFAIDWMRMEKGATLSGDAADPRSYYAYGQRVFAVADATVITARDGLPDNKPGHGDQFHPAIPITLDTVAGNTITLDIGGGEYAYYCHLQPGSMRVKAGDKVRRGQLLGLIGDSGDAREPHLHFEVSTSPKFALGEGVPYTIDSYQLPDAGLRKNEMPLDNMVMDFRLQAHRPQGNK
jgi:murein DD-endopeptidase MepM/ murein hydrolase activator NlpD